MSDAWRASIRAELQGAQAIVRESVPLARETHVRIGGPAAFFVEPMTEDAVSAVVRACRDVDAPMHVLGGGSNLVVADDGVPGVVMRLDRLNRFVHDGERLSAGAGVTLPSVVSNCKKVGLAGLETLVGIPAVVGGAVAMNAGTREGSTFDHLESILVCDADGQVTELARAELRPQYRDGGLGDRIVLNATFVLQPDDPDQIYERLATSLKRRNATQPVTEKSVGCVFRNPDGASAGQLIEQAGCKSLRRGSISVSPKHANYFVNEGDGTCADFLALMEDVRDRVRADSGAELQAEVKFWGL